MPTMKVIYSGPRVQTMQCKVGLTKNTPDRYVFADPYGLLVRTSARSAMAVDWSAVIEELRHVLPYCPAMRVDLAHLLDECSPSTPAPAPE